MKLRYILFVLIVGTLGGIAYYGISPLFKNIRLDELAPATETKNTELLQKSAAVIGTLAHPASGSVRIIKDSKKMYLRYENFKTINGPDLFVYLSKDKDATNFVNLGSLKATEGNINYEIPANVNINDYQYALTWCRQFGVLFNSADLSSI
ncbi:MAG: DM13 domain-containing protein [bacterium]|nr:DM13 domain-containing protein [bacterium]